MPGLVRARIHSTPPGGCRGRDLVARPVSPDPPANAYAQRLRAFLPREGFPHACTPNTVSSTRRQYASATFVFSADSPLVICISGPNPESVAVRLTII